MISGKINWTGCGREQSCPLLKYYPRISLGGLRKNHGISELRKLVSGNRLPVRTSLSSCRSGNTARRLRCVCWYHSVLVRTVQIITGRNSERLSIRHTLYSQLQMKLRSKALALGSAQVKQRKEVSEKWHGFEFLGHS
jgi:hypothetical protein